MKILKGNKCSLENKIKIYKLMKSQLSEKQSTESFEAAKCSIWQSPISHEWR